jgi:hypothetical protein
MKREVVDEAKAAFAALIRELELYGENEFDDLEWWPQIPRAEAAIAAVRVEVGSGKRPLVTPRGLVTQSLRRG